jgi:hypothetical protein
MKKTISTKPKSFCFVLMPFEDNFEDIYQLGIKESCTKAGAYCERVDEQIYHETILERIYNQIAKADFIIADMTGRNPNVFYEVGYAHALGKATLLLTQNADDIPFDLKHYPHIVYNNKISILKNELTNRIKWFIQNPPEEYPQYNTDVELYLGDLHLSTGNIVYNCPRGQQPNPILTVYNNSPLIYEPGDLRIGVITSGSINRCKTKMIDDTTVTIKLPDTRYIHNLSEMPTLFPKSYATLNITLSGLINNMNEYSESIIIRLFTKCGTRDFPLIINKTKPAD